MSLLKVDLHVHTNFSPDGEASPQEVIARCRKLGFSCIAITDHNTIAGAKDVQETASLRVIVGEEVMTSHGEVMGLFLKEEIPRNLTPVESMQAIKEQGGLVCVLPLNPCRPSKSREGSCAFLIHSTGSAPGFCVTQTPTG
jgi:predicted metal-dependent phosphoesterase TrpH